MAIERFNTFNSLFVANESRIIMGKVGAIIFMSDHLKKSYYVYSSAWMEVPTYRRDPPVPRADI